jgi:RND family efflux transporter MFP subunit
MNDNPRSRPAGRFASSSCCRRALHFAAALALASGLGACAEEVEPAGGARPVRAMKIGDVASFTARQFPGRAEAVRHADLSFRVPGTLMLMPARIGARVEEGEVIARLDPRDFEVRVRGGEAALARAQAERARAVEEFTRATTAFERNALSQIELVRIREAMNVAEATVQAIEADLQAARDDLSDTSMQAPFDGEIVARLVQKFEDVQPRQPVLRILDDQHINFTAFIPESMISVLPYVEEIRCEFDAFPGVEIVATIDEIGRESDDVTRTFPVTLVMDQPEGARILAGMTGRAWASRMREVEIEADAFDIPPAAVVDGANGERFVWVIDPASGVVSKRAVEVGRLTPAGMRVTGLERGDIVAIAGAAFLRDGQRVRVQDDLLAQGDAE